MITKTKKELIVAYKTILLTSLLQAMLDSAEKEETEIREMLLERKLEEAAAQEEAEREEALRNLLRRGDRSLAFNFSDNKCFIF